MLVQSCLSCYLTIFLSIDNRVKQANGATNIVLENGQQLLLPPLITKVPALLLLSKGNY